MTQKLNRILQQQIQYRLSKSIHNVRIDISLIREENLDEQFFKLF